MVRKGQHHTEEAKEKMSRNAHLRGKNMPSEVREKIRQTLIKKPYSHWTGKKFSKKHRQSISNGMRKAGCVKKEYGRSQMKWKDWRKAVISRDRRLCQICLSDEGLFVAHHIVPHKVNKSLMYDTLNGITLCRKCHADLHNFSLLTEKAVKTGKLQLLSCLLKALDNPVPSSDGNILEGVTTNGESHEDNNSDTSAAADRKVRDSLNSVVTQRSDA